MILLSEYIKKILNEQNSLKIPSSFKDAKIEIKDMGKNIGVASWYWQKNLKPVIVLAAEYKKAWEENRFDDEYKNHALFHSCGLFNHEYDEAMLTKQLILGKIPDDMSDFDKNSVLEDLKPYPKQSNRIKLLLRSVGSMEAVDRMPGSFGGIAHEYLAAKCPDYYRWTDIEDHVVFKYPLQYSQNKKEL